MNSTTPRPHRITSTLNDLDMVGITGGGFYRVGSASGPLGVGDGQIFIDNGPIKVGDMLMLPYNYDADIYARNGWACTVVRINPKTITVRSSEARPTRKVEWR